MRVIEKVWFEQHFAKWLLVPLLLPASALFWLLSALRRLAFKVQLKKQISVNKPVVVVGNIGVGGNGKTPVVIHLVALARQLGFTPGVISRGYGGKAPHYPYVLNAQSTTDEAGDEPVLIYQRCQVPVAVGADRVANAQLLITQGCDLIISDDGLQHYRLARDLELVIIDNKRKFGNGLLLPAGPLREGTWRLKQADLLILNGVATNAKLAKTEVIGTKTIDMNIDSSADASTYSKGRTLSMVLAATQVCHVATGNTWSLAAFFDKYSRINAVAGIGDPQRFFDTLTLLQFNINECRGFVDHHHFTITDFTDFSNELQLLMTEKDAVKCQSFAQAHWWYLPVDAQLSDNDQQILKQQLQQLIT